MRLALSSAAAPDLALAELLDVCERRGIEDLELIAGHAHGVAPGLAAARVAKHQQEIRAHKVRIAALHLPEARIDEAVELARLSVAFGAALVVPVAIAASAVTAKVAALLAREGGRLLLLHGSEEADAEGMARSSSANPSAALAWEVNPLRDDLRRAEDILGAFGGRLEYIRLLGSGPETAQCSGRGLGGLMARLALSRYAGTLVLAPSTPRYHYAWSAWLGRRGGWGCGSAGRTHALHPA